MMHTDVYEMIALPSWTIRFLEEDGDRGEGGLI